MLKKNILSQVIANELMDPLVFPRLRFNLTSLSLLGERQPHTIFGLFIFYYCILTC